MYCSHCGKSVDEEDLFCRFCGTKIKKDEEEQSINPEINKQDIDLLVDFEKVDTIEDTLDDNDILASLDVSNEENTYDDNVEENEDNYKEFINSTDGEVEYTSDGFVNEFPILDEDIEAFRRALESYDDEKIEIGFEEENCDLEITDEDIESFKNYLEQAEIDKQLEEAVNELKNEELDTEYDPDMYALPIADEDINSLIDYVNEKLNEEDEKVSEDVEVTEEDVTNLAKFFEENIENEKTRKFMEENPKLFNEDGTIKLEYLTFENTQDLKTIKEEIETRKTLENQEEPNEIQEDNTEVENEIQEEITNENALETKEVEMSEIVENKVNEKFEITNDEYNELNDFIDETKEEEKTKKFMEENPELFNEDGTIKLEYLTFENTQDLRTIKEEIETAKALENSKETEETPEVVPIKVNTEIQEITPINVENKLPTIDIENNELSTVDAPEVKDELHTIEIESNLDLPTVNVEKVSNEIPTVNVDETNIENTNTLNDLPLTSTFNTVDENKLGETKSLEELPLTNTLNVIDESTLGETKSLDELPLTGAINVVETPIEELDKTEDLATKIDPAIFEHSDETAVINVMPNPGLNENLKVEENTSSVQKVQEDVIDDEYDVTEKPKVSKLIYAIIAVVVLIIGFVIYQVFADSNKNNNVVKPTENLTTYNGLTFKLNDYLKESENEDSYIKYTNEDNTCTLTIYSLDGEDSSQLETDKIQEVNEKSLTLETKNINDNEWYTYKEENSLYYFKSYSNRLYTIEFNNSEDDNCNKALNDLEESISIK